MANTLINGPAAQGVTPAPSAKDTRVWMYRGTEERLFASLSDVPEGEGWSDTPGLAPSPAPEHEPEKPVKRKKADDGNSN